MKYLKGWVNVTTSGKLRVIKRSEISDDGHSLSGSVLEARNCGQDGQLRADSFREVMLCRVNVKEEQTSLGVCTLAWRTALTVARTKKKFIGFLSASTVLRKGNVWCCCVAPRVAPRRWGNEIACRSWGLPSEEVQRVRRSKIRSFNSGSFDSLDLLTRCGPFEKAKASQKDQRVKGPKL